MNSALSEVSLQQTGLREATKSSGSRVEARRTQCLNILNAELTMFETKNGCGLFKIVIIGRLS